MFAWFVLGGNAKSVEQNIEGFGNAVISPPINQAVNAWIKVAVIFSSLGLTVWFVESRIAKHEGQTVPLPPVQSIGPPTPPTFSATGGFGAQAGPIAVSQGVGAGQAAPVILPSSEARPRGESLASAVANRPGRLERKAARASSRADLAAARRREAEEKAKMAKARHGGFGRTRDWAA